ncbi:MAG: hypothetical protein WCB27_15840 [Thermoguttaceae bacterium]
MLRTRITYAIKPSFAAGAFCEFNPKERDGSYTVHVQDRNGQRRFSVPEERMTAIVRAVMELHLPPTSGPLGFDGTIHSLSIGVLTSVTYSWWQSIPSEWSALCPIVSEIVAICGLEKTEI